MMRRLLLVAAACLLAATGARAQDPRVLDYPTSSLFAPATPGVTGGALGSLFNPAGLGVSGLHASELAGWWQRRDRRDDWGVATSGLLGPGAFGLAVFDQEEVTTWQLGSSLGGRAARAGFAYRWASGGQAEDAVVAGLLLRGSRLVSCGVAGTWSTASAARQGVFDLGLRPFGTPVATLFADYTLDRDTRVGEGRWGAGLQVRPLPGLQLGLAAREGIHGRQADLVAHLGITTSGFLGVDHRRTGDGDAEALALRVNPPHRGLPRELGLTPPAWAELNLENKVVTYQKYRWFDDRRVAWLDLLRVLDAIAADATVEGVLVNLADVEIRPSLAWELRRHLAELREAGKEVVIHVHRVDFLDYYLASVADRLVIDPEGDVVLQGVALRRTYLADMLAKLGVGFEELRYFTYKSAMETFARRDQSEPDREQRQRIADVVYATVRDGVCAGRGLTPGQFDSLVDDELGFWPELARDRGLVDDVARWTDLREWVRRERGRDLRGPSPAAFAGAYPEEHWGQPRRVVVAYAVGACDMDAGIRGRALSAYLRGLKDDPTVAAVVLRADSPGGDPLPSDLVAGAVRALRAAGKPVVVSQGDVAASGGYWISMDGTEVVTTPVTVTGSIGVIGAWFWNDGLGDKLGLTTDGVQVGRHADLVAPLRFPLVGASLPVRPLDDQERELVRRYIVQAYDTFVAAVAAGRGLDEAAVRAIAEGRVWMGEDAVARGLCDRVGSLRDAIDLARELAGIPAGREVELVEYPPRPLFDLGNLLALRGLPFGLLQPRAWRLARAAAPVPAPEEPPDHRDAYLESLAARPGRAVAIVPPDGLPVGWEGVP